MISRYFSYECPTIHCEQCNSDKLATNVFVQMEVLTLTY